MHNLNIFSLALILILSLSACSTTGVDNLPPWEKKQAVKYADIQQFDANITTVKINLRRKVYKRALAEGGNLNTARLIKTFSSHQNGFTPPQYRVFDVQQNSVYQVLHLATADVILAAGGYVIPDQSIFWQYLNLMAQLDGGSLIVVRSGRTFNLEYKFID